jgi:uncharacterized delta-60 repeat protein
MPGALDHSFGNDGTVITKASPGGRSGRVDIAAGPDGTIVAAAGKTVFRYLADGSLDPSFGENGKVTIADPGGLPFALNDLAVDSKGRIVLFGEVQVLTASVVLTYLLTPGHPWMAAVIRYDPSGQIDTSFGEGDGFVLTDFNQPPYEQPSEDAPYAKAFTGVARGVVDPSDDLVVVGTVTEFVASCVGHSGATPFQRLIARLTPAGQLDPTFGGGDGVLSSIGLQSIEDIVLGDQDEPLVIGWAKEHCGGSIPYSAMRLLSNGDVDTGFGSDGRRVLNLESPVALAANGSGGIVILSGANPLPRGGSRSSALRLTPQGNLDRRFGDRGVARIRLSGRSRLNAVKIEPSGRVLLIGTQMLRRNRSKGYESAFTVIRLSPSGRPDRHFGHNGWVATPFGGKSSAAASGAFIDSNGRLVVAGTVNSAALGPRGGIALARYELNR